MLVKFKDLPKTSRVWIYQANRSFSSTEISDIQIKLNAFIESWIAHGSNLKASYEIRYNRFIVIALDQDTHAASGCSIDASVHFIQQLEREYNVILLDKMNVSFKQGEFVAYKPLLEFKKMAKNKSVSKNTIVFNNLVTNVDEYLQFWEVPAKDSWHSRFLN